jgi:LysM domain
VSTLLSILLKQRTGALLVGGTLAAVAFLLMLPSVAEAQEEQQQQEVQQQTISVEGAQQPAHELAGRLVVAPGDSLWSISHQRLHPNATTQQISNEAGRIYELNRSRIGDDPSLIFPGQELLAPPAATPTTVTTPTTAAAPATVAGEPAPVAERASEAVEEEPAVLPELPQMEADPESYKTSAEASTEAYYFIGLEGRVLGAAAAGVGVGMTMLALVLALVLAIVKARRTSVKRSVDDPTAAGGVPVGGYGRNSENYAHLAKDCGSTASTSERDSDSEEENNQELSNAQGGRTRVGFGTNPGDGAHHGR